VPAKNSASDALNLVIAPVENHPNLASFVSKQLIQFLVTSNPTPAYVSRVSIVFNADRFGEFGAGRKGDLKAVVAAILPDVEARCLQIEAHPKAGMLKALILRYVCAIRAFNGSADGEEMRISWIHLGLAPNSHF
jgi:uncharacterized protein (DUF1800 family)